MAKLISGPKLKEGKTYRLVKAGASGGRYTGIVLRVFEKNPYLVQNVLVEFLDVADTAPYGTWSLYESDKYQELSDEEVMMYKLQKEA